MTRMKTSNVRRWRISGRLSVNVEDESSELWMQTRIICGETFGSRGAEQTIIRR